MKKVFVILLALSIFSCDDKVKEKELELKEKELELQEKQLEQQHQQQTQTTVQEPVAQEELIVNEPDFETGIITGKSVIMRKSHTTQSAALGKFRKGETVYILDEYRASNNNEAITKRAVKLYNSSGRYVYTLNPGKAVRIVEDYTDSYRVSFQDTKHGTVYANIDQFDLEFISGDKWYKVQRKNGDVCWVFSKFVQ